MSTSSNYDRVRGLAVQLAFAVNEHIEGDVEDDPLALDMPMPPTRWSPMRAMAFWDALPDAVQQAWLKYAQKVSIFAGVSSAEKETKP